MDIVNKMILMARPSQKVVLTVEQERDLKMIVLSTKAEDRMVLRANIILDWVKRIGL